MAEAIAIISLISSITQLAEFSSKLAKRINEFVSATPELPPCFQHICTSLPLLTHIVRALYQKAYSGNLTVENQRDLLFVIQSLDKELRDLSDLLQSITPDANARRWERGLKAIKSVKIQKSVEAVQVRIEGYMGNLNAYLNLRNSDAIDTLVEAARKKGSIEVNNRIEKKRRISMLDLDREENFVGREHVMHSVDERFNAGGRRVAIVGIGGVGYV